MSCHRFLLRLPESVFAELSESAYRNRRSVNSEIVWRLSERDVEAGVSTNVADPTGSRAPVASRSESAPFKPDFGKKIKV